VQTGRLDNSSDKPDKPENSESQIYQRARVSDKPEKPDKSEESTKTKIPIYYFSDPLTSLSYPIL
jgi:hypothetical protein